MYMRLLMVIVAVGAVNVATPVCAADKGVSKEVREFIARVESDGLKEVMLGQLAKEKAYSPAITNFGSRMVTDHGKANEELKAIAVKKKVTVPLTLEKKDQKTVDRLNAFSGKEFDTNYMTEMVKDHARDVADFRKARTSVKDPELERWIGKTLPMLEEHLKLSKEVARNIGVDVK